MYYLVKVFLYSLVIGYAIIVISFQVWIGGRRFGAWLFNFNQEVKREPYEYSIQEIERVPAKPKKKIYGD